MIADVLAGRRSWHVEACDVMAGLASLPSESIHVCVTSPPYWGLRNYGVEGQIGLEPTVDAFVEQMVAVFREVRRVLRKDGTCWINLGDSYANDPGNGRGGENCNGGVPHRSATSKLGLGLKRKDLIGLPWRVAFALQADGWWLRSAITWCKKAAMPESVTDRPTSATEMVFLLSRSPRYFYDADAVREPHEATRESEKSAVGGVVKGTSNPIDRSGDVVQGRGWTPADRSYNPAGRNLRNYWLLGPEPYAEAHFATFPTEIPRRAILAGTSAHGVCGACGAPYRRVVERGALVKDANARFDDWDRGKFHEAGGDGVEAGRAAALKHAGFKPNHRYETTTTGWSSGCRCGAGPPLGAVVLDPFAGSGTTLMVALRHGRRAIGFDLNAGYVRLARDRITMDCPMWNGFEAGG